MPSRARTRQSFASIARQRVLQSKRTETRLSDRQRLVPPEDPFPVGINSGAFSSPSEAVIVFAGATSSSADLSVIAEGGLTFQGSTSDFELANLVFTAEAAMTFVGEGNASSSFSSTAEAAMVFQGSQSGVEFGAFSAVAEGAVTFSGASNNPGRFVSSAESVVTVDGASLVASPINFVADALVTMEGSFGVGVTSGAFSASAEALTTMRGESIAASPISAIAEAISTMAGSISAGISAGAFSSIAESSNTFHHAELAQLGVWHGAWNGNPANSSPTAVTGFETWSGANVYYATDVGPLWQNGWSAWATANGVGPRWAAWLAADSRRRLVIKTALVATGSTLQFVIDGTSDVNWQQFADYLAANNLLSRVVIRLGFQMDTTGLPWSAPPGDINVPLFIPAFRKAVDVMRARQPSNQWLFHWSPRNALDLPLDNAYLESIYPGNSYVDEIGMEPIDFFGPNYPYPASADTQAERLPFQTATWNDRLLPRLTTFRDYAISKNKAFAIPEWGPIYMEIAGVNYGGADNPFYVEQMGNYVFNSSNNVRWHSLNNMDGTGFFGRIEPTTQRTFTLAQIEYQEAFGVVTLPPPPDTSIAVGVRHLPPPPDTSYETSIGRSPDVWVDYCSGRFNLNGDWSWMIPDPNEAGNLDNYNANFATNNKRLHLMFGFCPWAGATSGGSVDNGAMLAAVAAGTHNAKYAQFATALKNLYPNLVNRRFYFGLGWEMNYSWSPWKVLDASKQYSSTHAANWAAACRQIITSIRTAEPTIDWRFAFMPGSEAWRLSSWYPSRINTMYPGDGYIDLIGATFYDGSGAGQYSAPPTDAQRTLVWNTEHLAVLNNMNSFASTHGKPQCFGEWGIWHSIGSTTLGGDDNPDYIQKVYDWVTDPAHNFEYVAYFNRNVSGFIEHSLTNFGTLSKANSRAKYIDTFGQLPHPF